MIRSQPVDFLDCFRFQIFPVIFLFLLDLLMLYFSFRISGQRSSFFNSFWVLFYDFLIDFIEYLLSIEYEYSPHYLLSFY